MKTAHLSRPRRRLLLAVPLTLTAGLFGCGGGEDNYETVDLEAAYEAIAKGMSYTYVRSVVGRDPDTTTPNGSSSLLYRWETGRNTYLFTTLIIEIDSKLGVVSKTVTGPNGNKTERF